MATTGSGNTEIERKYLLRRMPRLPGGARALRIDQGYIPGEEVRERLRRVRTAGRTRYYRTMKLGSGLSRLEFEEETTGEIFRALWRATRGRRLRKVRYEIEHEGLVWQIYRFLGFELVLAEVELETESQPVGIPEWLAPVLEREVTGEAEYGNSALAR